jgi:hypothetical protein
VVEIYSSRPVVAAADLVVSTDPAVLVLPVLNEVVELVLNSCVLADLDKTEPVPPLLVNVTEPSEVEDLTVPSAEAWVIPLSETVVVFGVEDELVTVPSEEEAGPVF